MKWQFWKQKEVDNKPDGQVASGKKRNRNPRHPNRDTKGKWLPGISGNPEGRPPDTRYISETLRELGVVEPEELHGTGWTRNRLLAWLLWNLALSEKDKGAIDTVLDRTEGKVTQKFEGDVTFRSITDLAEELANLERKSLTSASAS